MRRWLGRRSCAIEWRRLGGSWREGMGTSIGSNNALMNRQKALLATIWRTRRDEGGKAVFPNARSLGRCWSRRWSVLSCLHKENADGTRYQPLEGAQVKTGLLHHLPEGYPPAARERLQQNG